MNVVADKLNAGGDMRGAKDILKECTRITKVILAAEQPSATKVPLLAIWKIAMNTKHFRCQS